MQCTPRCRGSPQPPAGVPQRRELAASRGRAQPTREAGLARLPARTLARVRWLIDGMNVIGTRPDTWWKDRHAAIIRLGDLLERWAPPRADDLTLLPALPPPPPLHP